MRKMMMTTMKRQRWMVMRAWATPPRPMIGLRGRHLQGRTSCYLYKLRFQITGSFPTCKRRSKAVSTAARSVQWVYFWDMRVRWCLKPQLDMDGIEAFCEFYSTLSIRDQDDFNREVDLGVQHRRLQQLRRARQNLKRDCICYGG
ncbi:hypothetical protein KM472_gp049 [Cynomolgus macaque cytomegalovirus strain Ottawa]|uniref:Uncharacterized protein n=1 Tax=macacine betaherpesvirus 8 TaxID=2560567 RepID=G8H152_9BETA|nr:hypothetical protein KM472_gp049 [Cynomolgus macaque cytomegalovirus strain Ottawa]AEQ32126.1 hypothetical protein cy49 [Cynomolgus macaque cytomegalovirus strain Ottawa]